MIPATLARITATAGDVDAIFEESKDGVNVEEARKLVVEWYRSRIFEMTESLTNSEKITVISKVMDMMSERGHEP